jgi:hypothetical protein
MPVKQRSHKHPEVEGRVKATQVEDPRSSSHSSAHPLRIPKVITNVNLTAVPEFSLRYPF